MARLRDRLIAHGPAVDDLLATLQDETVSATLLFAGPSGVGKKLAALCVAQSLMCEKSREACGHCPSCIRVEAGTHEGVRLVAPEGTQIKADQARDIVEYLQLQSWGRGRIIIIEDAHLLNPQAANSLLKVLEEPPAGTVFVMLAPSPSALLPTLRSRSRAMLFRPLTEDEMKRVMAAPSWALKASRGSLDRLQGLLDPAESEARLDAAGVLTAMFETPNFLLENFWREGLREKGALGRWLPLWTSLLRDALVKQWGGEQQLINPDLARPLEALAKRPRTELLETLAKLQEIEAGLRFNRDPQLCIEELWVSTHH